MGDGGKKRVGGERPKNCDCERGKPAAMRPTRPIYYRITCQRSPPNP